MNQQINGWLGMSLYDNANSNIRVNGKLGEEFDVSFGVHYYYYYYYYLLLLSMLFNVIYTDMPLLFCIPAGTPCRGRRRSFFKKIFVGGSLDWLKRPFPYFIIYNTSFLFL